MHLSNFGRLTRAYYYRILRLYGTVPELWPSIWSDPQFEVEARKLGFGMAQQVAKVNGRSWREIAMKSSRARRIYEGLQAELRHEGLAAELEWIAVRNGRLISSLPEELARDLTKRAARMQMAGARPGDVAREIRRFAPHLLKSRVQTIARTEVSRAETDLTRARSEHLGIEWYQWQTSEDSRVRASHRNMDQVLVAWNDAPSPEALIHEKSTLGRYHAGQAPNCRCVSLPVADVDEIRWPARVFQAGRIVRMTRAQFTHAVGIPVAA